MKGQLKQKDSNSSIPKKKKKKGTAIIAGSTFGVINNTIVQRTPNSNTLGNKDFKIPRKQNPVVATVGKHANSKSKEETKTNEKPRSSNSKWNANQSRENIVVVRIHEGADMGAIRSALDSKLPEKLQNVLGEASLELNDQGHFVIRKEAGVWHNYGNARKMLSKNKLPGWIDWFRGRRGWVMESDKLPFLDFHRNLHDAYSGKMKELLKQADPNLKKSLVVLYYKQDPLTQENNGPRNGTRQNTQTIWKKVAKQESLQDAVGKIRPFLEVLRYFCTDPIDRWTSLPWRKLLPNSTLEQSKRRLEKVSSLVSVLMRSSEWGPDVPVHWAAHPPLNHYPRSVVTSATMTELVVGVANILSQLFLPYPIEVSNLDGVRKLIPKFSSWSVTPGRNDRTDTAKKRSTEGSNIKKPDSSRRLRNPSASNPVEPRMIDLTNELKDLSI